MLSENEDKLGTLVVATPKSKDLHNPLSSSSLLGEKNVITARAFAEYIASLKEKIAVVSVYLESSSDLQAQSIFRKLVERILHAKTEKESVSI